MVLDVVTIFIAFLTHSQKSENAQNLGLMWSQEEIIRILIVVLLELLFHFLQCPNSKNISHDCGNSSMHRIGYFEIILLLEFCKISDETGLDIIKIWIAPKILSK